MSRKLALRALATAGALVAAACHDATTPTDSPAGPDAAVQQAPRTPDLALLARSVPGFGGFYLDDGVPTVYLTDVSRVSVAEAALAGYGFSGVRVQQGRYTYQQLDGWFWQVSAAALAHTGVVFVDLDEANNRVLVGVENPAGAAIARRVVARLGVPAAAVAIQETEPIHYVATLRDRVRPLVGGLQIRFEGFLCTLGFNAELGTNSGFLINSHCTTNESTVDGTLYYQPLNQVADEFIGTEILDPPFFQRTNGCPPGRLCRWSDAAYAERDANATATLGGIAKTTGANNGSLEIAGGFSIRAEATTNATVGEIVNKVGRTTGWTQGQVTNSCVNTGVSGTRIVRLCQDFVSAGVGAGDSGSPVFAITSGDDVTLKGILWGGNSSGTSFVYSPQHLVERELGALTTHN